MQGLYRYLPPPSSDIAGACSALFGLGGIVVVHEPACCTSSYTMFDEPRYYGSNTALFSSELREIHISTGDDETFLKRVEAAVDKVDAAFIAIVGSPVPMFAGTDYKALARIIEKRTGIPSFMIDTGGFKRYDVGISEAFLKLAMRFVNPEAKMSEQKQFGKKGDNQKGYVNIIGATPLDTIAYTGFESLKKALSLAGYSILSVWTRNLSLGELDCAGDADINIVISSSGIKLAQYFQDRFGTPFIVEFPVGENQLQLFLQRIDNILSGAKEDSNSFDETLAGCSGRKGLILGEQIVSNGIRNLLQNDFGLKDVTVATFFPTGKPCMDPCDLFIEDETSLERIVTEKQYNLVIGDSLFSEFFPQDVCFVSIPHIAVSGYSPFTECPDLYGAGGTDFFQQQIKGIF